GVVGDLYIGGAGLARGYLHRPELTKERFVPDPFNPGVRVYKTGDLARFTKDGELEFLGRTDHQVKIRGFRIEIGEIETALSRHSSVTQSVVVAADEHFGEKQLVGYIVSRGPAASVSDLRQFLKGSLPEYMIPSAFVFLERLPL